MQFNLRGDRGHPFCSTLQLSRSFKMLHWFLRAAFGKSFCKGQSIASIAQGPALRSIGKGGFVKPPGFLYNIPVSKNSIHSCGFYLTLTAKKLLLQFFLNAVHCVPTTPPSAHPCAPGG